VYNSSFASSLLQEAKPTFLGKSSLSEVGVIAAICSISISIRSS
jgi:hypothetical protein